LSKATNKEKLLDAKQWTFVKDGLDDFRDGKPPSQSECLIKVTCLLKFKNKDFKIDFFCSRRKGLRQT
jgi:hypothetical protein